jgi:predicted extracellular nuclease
VAFDPAMWEGPFPLLATGDRLGDVTGVVDYEYGAFQLTAVAPVRVELASTWRPETTALRRGRGRLTVATYNVLNLSPDSSDERQRTLLGAQIARALGAPDIVALQEIQDESGERDDGAVDGRPTLAALARAIREAGGPTYAFVEVAPENGRPGGVPGGNIRNAFLYDPRRVMLRSHRALTPDVLRAAGAPRPDAFAQSRDPLEAVLTLAGRRVVVINNHLTSRFGSTPVFGAVQPWVQAGEAEREAQARALHAYVARLVSADTDARVIVLGDMNTFEETDDLASILPGSAPVLLPLIPRVPEPQRYSYIFEGNSQVLDHIFVSSRLAVGAEIDVVHLNADFPAEVPASDHDPVVARFQW